MQMPSANAAPAPQMVSERSSGNYRVEIANLRADIQSLDRRIREMDIAMEDVLRRNQDLTGQLERQQRNQAGQLNDVVREGQLNAVIADIQKSMAATDGELRRQIIREVTQQIEQLGKQTQAAIDAVARNAASRPAPAASSTARSSANFSDDFPQTGVSYTVQRGDTLSGIASKHKSSIRDIQNANKISDPSTIQIGQTLFIPQRSN